MLPIQYLNRPQSSSWAVVWWALQDLDMSTGAFLNEVDMEIYRHFNIGNRSRDYNARFTATYRTVSVYRVLQMRG